MNEVSRLASSTPALPLSSYVILRTSFKPPKFQFPHLSNKSTGFPHYLKEEHPQGTFCKPKWCKVKKQLP